MEFINFNIKPLYENFMKIRKMYLLKMKNLILYRNREVGFPNYPKLLIQYVKTTWDIDLQNVLQLT